MGVECDDVRLRGGAKIVLKFFVRSVIFTFNSDKGKNGVRFISIFIQSFSRFLFCCNLLKRQGYK